MGAMGVLWNRPTPIAMDREYQAWVLVAMTFVVFGLLCCPCCWPRHCCTPMLRFIRRRLLIWVAVALFLDWCLLEYTCELLPDWSLSNYFDEIFGRIGWFFANLEEILLSVLVIVVAVVVFVLRTQILKLLGIEHMTMVRWSVSDLFSCCFETRKYQAIEVACLQVKHLQSAVMFRPNDVFVEFHLGFNEVMCTRVFYGAGEDCKLKQSVQLNFDDKDSSYDLYIIVKHQDVMTSQEVARYEMSVEEVARKISSESGTTWDEREFFKVDLKPQGELWLRITEIGEENDQATVMTRLMGSTNPRV